MIDDATQSHSVPCLNPRSVTYIQAPFHCLFASQDCIGKFIPTRKPMLRSTSRCVRHCVLARFHLPPLAPLLFLGGVPAAVKVLIDELSLRLYHVADALGVLLGMSFNH